MKTFISGSGEIYRLFYVLFNLTSVLYKIRLPVTRWVKLNLNFEFLVPK